MTDQTKWHDDEHDDAEDELIEKEEPGFERIRRNTGKAPTLKSDRRQQQKEWGRQHAKFHKQRKSKKP